MFNEIDIQRDNADGTTTQNIRVPLSFTNLNKNLLQDRPVLLTSWTHSGELQ